MAITATHERVGVRFRAMVLQWPPGLRYREPRRRHERGHEGRDGWPRGMDAPGVPGCRRRPRTATPRSSARRRACCRAATWRPTWGRLTPIALRASRDRGVGGSEMSTRTIRVDGVELTVNASF